MNSFSSRACSASLLIRFIVDKIFLDLKTQKQNEKILLLVLVALASSRYSFLFNSGLNLNEWLFPLSYSSTRSLLKAL